MSKILIISAVFPPEPVVTAKLSYDIANALLERNIVTVISPKPSRPFGFKFKDEKLHFNFNHIQVNSFVFASSSLLGRFKESYSFGKHCYRHIAHNHQNTDLIYINTWPLFAQYYAVKAATKYHIPIIVHVQDIYPESLSEKSPIFASFFNFMLLPLDKYILGKASKVIAISGKTKAYLVKSRKLEEEKFAVVHNWHDEGSFNVLCEPPIRTEGSSFTFMYLGNIGPVAGIDLLLKAFARSKLKNSRLVIAGSGSMKESLEKQAGSFTDSIIEFWTVDEGKVPEVQSMADVMILPIKKDSASTSVPSKLPAYMFSAKPIIACVDDNSDTADAVKEAKCGWVIEPENIEVLSNLMKNIIGLKNEELKEKGTNGRDYALAHFSKKNNLPKIIKIIEDTTLKSKS